MTSPGNGRDYAAIERPQHGHAGSSYLLLWISRSKFYSDGSHIAADISIVKRAEIVRRKPATVGVSGESAICLTNPATLAKRVAKEGRRFGMPSVLIALWLCCACMCICLCVIGKRKGEFQMITQCLQIDH